MAYIEPTIADLKVRYPDFAGVADPVLQSALDEANSKVDTSWFEKDYTIGKLLFAAHVLTMDGQGAGREAKFSALAAAGISQIKIASLSLSISRPSSINSERYRSLLSSTSYGQRYLQLVRLNAPGVAVTNGYP